MMPAMNASLLGMPPATGMGFPNPLMMVINITSRRGRFQLPFKGINELFFIRMCHDRIVTYFCYVLLEWDLQCWTRFE
jgi:hypothetical protein